MLEVEVKSLWEYLRWRRYVWRSWHGGQAAMGFSEWYVNQSRKAEEQKSRRAKCNLSEVQTEILWRNWRMKKYTKQNK